MQPKSWPPYRVVNKKTIPRGNRINLPPLTLKAVSVEEESGKLSKLDENLDENHDENPDENSDKNPEKNHDENQDYHDDLF